MILPIYLLGNEELREPTREITEDSPSLQALIDDMIDTMHGAAGIGLAAPQVGRNERLFVVDLTELSSDRASELDGDESKEWPDQPMVFINAKIVSESEELCDFEEGCLSIPDVHEIVVRPQEIRMAYMDRNFEPQEKSFTGMLARVVQHEYDHVEGILFLDYLTPLKRRLMKRKLADIRGGNVDIDYPVHVVEVVE